MSLHITLASRVKERRSHLGRQSDRPAMAAATACQVAASNSQRGKTMQAMVESTLILHFVNTGFSPDKSDLQTCRMKIEE